MNCISLFKKRVIIIYTFELRPDGRKGIYYRKLMFWTRRDQNIGLPPQRYQHIVFLFLLNQSMTCMCYQKTVFFYSGGTKNERFPSLMNRKYYFGHSRRDRKMVFTSPDRLTHSIVSLLDQWMVFTVFVGSKPVCFYRPFGRGQKGTFSIPVGPKNDILYTRDQNIVFTYPKGLTHSVLPVLDSRPMNGVYRPCGTEKRYFSSLRNQESKGDQKMMFWRRGTKI